VETKLTNVLLIAKRTEMIEKVETILSEYFHNITRVSEVTDTGQLLPGRHFDLIVVTDSLQNKPNRDFLQSLKSVFPNAKFIYLVHEIAQQMEMSLRTVGLTFLGNYDHFIRFARQIIGTAADSKKTEGPRA
jgi:DNA-binding NtrC family response regulator